jgi:hypothetical protein
MLLSIEARPRLAVTAPTSIRKPIMRRLASGFGLLLSVFSLATLIGCSDPQNRQDISGEVKLFGQPIEDGVINFEPLDGQGTGDGAMIRNGEYRIGRAKGLTPGKYRVTIYAGDGGSGAGDASPDPPKNRGKGKERVPPAYNTKSDVVREVTSAGPNKFDFDIR